MLSLMPLIVISGLVAYVFAVLKMTTAAIAAPVGYEDDAGFHYGLETVSREDRE